jgi:hypothetical protein
MGNTLLPEVYCWRHCTESPIRRREWYHAREINAREISDELSAVFGYPYSTMVATTTLGNSLASDSAKIPAPALAGRGSLLRFSVDNFLSSVRTARCQSPIFP